MPTVESDILHRSTELLADTAVIFSCDQHFVPLAKGLVLSLRIAKKCGALFCIDIGLDDHSKSWFRQHEVTLVKFGWDRLFETRREWRSGGYRLAQFVRPFLPRLIPQYDYYIWLDADTWIQDPWAIATLRSAVHDTKVYDIALVPQVDFSYRVFRQQWGGPVEWSGWWYRELYGETIAKDFCNKAILNSGVFCMRADSLIWRAWETEIRSVLKKKISDSLVLHVAEQTCLNYIAYSNNKTIFVDSIYNYTLHDGCAKRSDNDVVVIDYPPYRPISIVHLTSSSKYMENYLEDGLLFDRGGYLSEEERKDLLSLNHY